MLAPAAAVPLAPPSREVRLVITLLLLLLLLLLLARVLLHHRELLREKHRARVAQPVARKLLVRPVQLLGVFALVEAAHIHQHLGKAAAVGARLAGGAGGDASAPASAPPVLVLVRLDHVVDDRVRVLLRAVDVRHARRKFELGLAPPAALDIVVVLRRMTRGVGLDGGGRRRPLRRGVCVLSSTAVPIYFCTTATTPLVTGFVPAVSPFISPVPVLSFVTLSPLGPLVSLGAIALVMMRP